MCTSGSNRPRFRGHFHGYPRPGIQPVSVPAYRRCTADRGEARSRTGQVLRWHPSRQRLPFRHSPLHPAGSDSPRGTATLVHRVRLDRTPGIGSPPVASLDRSQAPGTYHPVTIGGPSDVSHGASLPPGLQRLPRSGRRVSRRLPKSQVRLRISPSRLVSREHRRDDPPGPGHPGEPCRLPFHSEVGPSASLPTPGLGRLPETWGSLSVVVIVPPLVSCVARPGGGVEPRTPRSPLNRLASGQGGSLAPAIRAACPRSGCEPSARKLRWTGGIRTRDRRVGHTRHRQ